MVGNAKKGIESTHSMTTTAAKGANSSQKMSQFGVTLHIFQTLIPRKLHIFQTTSDYDRRPDHTFPEVLLGFLHIFPNKKPLSSGFLEGFQNVI